MKAYNETSYNLAWGHLDATFEPWGDQMAKYWPNIPHFTVVRDPIQTLCTHFHNNTRLTPEKQIRKLHVIKNNLELYRRVQVDYLARFKPYIHKVEDPIEQLSEWAGVVLQPGETHSRPNDLRAAVLSRDLDAVADTLNYTDLFEWFITQYSASLAPLYRDQLGYDFWWHNG
jgi:hypothetical protein